MVAVAGYVVGGLDLREDFGEEGLLEALVVVGGFGGVAAAFGGGDVVEVAVAEGHDYDHGLDLALGEEVVEDEVGFAYGGPAIGAFVEAVEEVEDWVESLGGWVVAWWGVDVVVVLVAGEV